MQGKIISGIILAATWDDYIIPGIIIIIVLALILTNIRVVPQATEYVVERLGKYHDTWKAGLHVKLPILDQIKKQVTVKEQVLDTPPQPVITKDNVTMQIDSIVYFHIFVSQAMRFIALRSSASENASQFRLRL